MNEKQKKAIRDFVDYIVTPIAIALLVIFVVFAASKAVGMGVLERYGIAATRDDITEAVDPIARQAASNETAIASHSSQLSQLSQSLDGKLASTSAAPAWVSGNYYRAYALCSYYGVVYQNTSGAAIQSATTPDTSGSGWTAKPVSELFLPLTGGTLTGPLVVGSIESNVYVGQMDSGAELTIGHLRHAPCLLRINCYGAIHILDSNGSYQFTVQIPYKSGTLALTSDIPDVSGYAAKADSPTAGNLAALDAQGNPTDSGISTNDVITTTSAAWIDVTNRLAQLERQMQN